MPTYKVTDPESGRSLKLTGDSPPTEQELHDVFAQFKDAPADTPRPASDSGEALLTNLPAQGFTQNLVRGLPAAAGALIGGAAGAPLGPAGMIAGAGLGGAAGEAVRKAASQVTAAAFPEQKYPIDSAGQVLKDVGTQGATQAAGEALGLGLGAVRPYLNKVGAQVMRVGAGIPEKAGMAAMRNPSVLLDAPTSEVASDAYKAFENYTGLKGLGDSVASAGKFPGEGELEKNLFEAAQKAAQGTATPQELYLASQSASSLNQLGKMGNPRYAMLKSAISQAKNAVDDALEKALPEYASLRSGYAASKTADQFSSLLPLNNNTTPNVLRGVTAATTAAAGTMAGNPAALAALPLVSPRFYGTLLKGAAIAGKIPAGVYQSGAAALAGSAASELAQAYARQRPATP